VAAGLRRRMPRRSANVRILFVRLSARRMVRVEYPAATMAARTASMSFGRRSTTFFFPRPGLRWALIRVS